MDHTNKKIGFINFLFFYIFLVAAFSLISYNVFIENFKELEEKKNTEEINIIINDMTKTMRKIQNITNDYSYWDESYNFVATQNPEYIDENFRLNNSNFNDLELDFIIYVNLKNKIIFSKHRNKIKPIDQFDEQIIKMSINSQEFNTLSEIDSKIFYLRKSKIVKNDNSGNFNGFIYSGKYITKSFIDEYKNIFKDIKFFISDKENNTKKIEKSYLHSLSIQTYLQDDCFVNRIDFYDIFNNYIFSIEAKNFMKIVDNGKKTILLYNIAIAFLLLGIFVILSKAQDDLFQNNIKLESEVNERTETLNKYVNIVNKYVTTSSTDLEGRITQVSEAFCRISGYSKEELIGRTHNIVKHEDMDPKVYEDLWETITTDQKWVGEIKNKKKNGEEYWVLANIEPTYSSSGKKIGYTSIRQEITDKKRVEKLSVTDKLTQLYNRVRLEEIFMVEIAKFHRYHTCFSVILIDIDFFKQVNDTYGHNVGDVFLRELSDLLRSSIRIDDVVGRWGGEEFIILSNNYSIEGVMRFAEKIRKTIEEHTFSTVGHKTASIGVSILNKEDTQESVVYRADKSLYQAKKLGRNRVCLH
ncbi:MAG: diguanylate cyclase [Arcobacteraceae bacterium]